jgi:hypothetical protein
MLNSDNKLSLQQLREQRRKERRPLDLLFDRHQGEKYQLALRLQMDRSSVTHWLKGRSMSPKIQKAVEERAVILRAVELERKRAKKFIVSTNQPTTEAGQTHEQRAA